MCLYFCITAVLFWFLTNVDVRLLQLNKPVSQSVSHVKALQINRTKLDWTEQK